MLTLLDFWHLVERIIPLYVIVIAAYALTRLDVIAPEHTPGISRWVSLLGVPTYVFHLLAFNDPYNTSMQLVAADILSKAVTLIFSCLWWKFSESGSIDGMIGFFMLATLPNTVLIGDALLQPLYGEQVHTEVVTIIFMQSLLWYNVCICLYEARIVLLEEKQLQEAAVQQQLHSRNLQEKPVADEHIICTHECGGVNGFVTVSSTRSSLERKMSSWNDGPDHAGAAAAATTASVGNGNDERRGSFQSHEDFSQESLARRSTGGIGDGFLSKQGTSERAISAPAWVFPSSSRSLSLPRSFKRTPKSKVCDCELARDNFSDPLAKETIAVEKMSGASGNDPAVVAMLLGADNADHDREQESQKRNSNEMMYFRDQEEDPEIDSEKSGNFKKRSETSNSAESDSKKVEAGLRSRGFARWGILGVKMMNRMKKVPLTYASIAGFTYSLLAYKYHWDMPYPVRNSLELISDGAIGMAIFLMGMAWARTGRLISCGWKALVYGIIVRFLIGPILMIISAKAVLFHGQPFRVAVLQAVIPQGVISFVLAKEYGVDVPLFNTAVIFQLVIFLPIVMCYYYILDAF